MQNVNFKNQALLAIVIAIAHQLTHFSMLFQMGAVMLVVGLYTNFINSQRISWLSASTIAALTMIISILFFVASLIFFKVILGMALVPPFLSLVFYYLLAGMLVRWFTTMISIIVGNRIALMINPRPIAPNSPHEPTLEN